MFLRVSGACALVLCLALTASADDQSSEWTALFDGESLAGWTANENPGSWKVEDGAIVAQGKPRSHLFYTGNTKPFKNFELQLQVYTEPGANGGVYFHTRPQESGWPKYGYEAQVNNTHKDPKKTGSLYAVDNVLQAPAKDNQWFTMNIRVQGQHIVIKVDGKTVVDFTEEPDRKAGKDFTRKVDQGTFALQAHDPKSVVKFRDIKVKRLE